MVQFLLLNRNLPHIRYFSWAYCYSTYEWSYYILDKWFNFFFGSHLVNDM